MHKAITEQKCRRHRLKMSWMCVQNGCNTPIFCKKCRLKHDKLHERKLYPLNEILEEEGDVLTDQFEFEQEDKQDLLNKVEHETDSAKRKFLKELGKAQRELNLRIEEYHLTLSTKLFNNRMKEFRRAVKKNPGDVDALKKLGREYHSSLQESQINYEEQQKILETIQEDINYRFNSFNKDLAKILQKLGSGQKYKMIKEPQIKESTESQQLVESKVENNVVPEEWNRDNVTEDVNKSLLMIQNKYKSREEKDE